MPGQWLQTMEFDGESFTAGTASQTQTINLPRSNFLGAVFGRIIAAFSAGTSPTVRVDITRLRVIANGSAIIVDLEGDELAAIVKYETGRAPTDGGAASTSPSVEHFMIPFGRGRRDEEVILPAKAFKSLQLQLTFELTATGGPTIDSVTMDLGAEQWVSNDPVSSKTVLRRTIVGSEDTVSANEVVRQDIPLGNNLRAIYIHADDPDNLRGSNIRLLVNGGSEIPFTLSEELLAEAMLYTYRFHDDALPGAGTTRVENVYKIDFDVLEDLSKLIDTSNLNDLKVEITGAASGVNNGVQFIVEELIAVEA